MLTEDYGQADVQKLRQDIETAIAETVNRLRSIESAAQQQLRLASVEQQHLEGFLDELSYRLRSITDSGKLPVTITGPITETQLSSMHVQEGTLRERKSVLEKTHAELELVSNRLSWLIHQIEGACSYVTSNGEPESEADQSPGIMPTSGDQVMWAQIIMGQEAERARLAREIHDGPAQVLANTVMRLQFVEQMQKHTPGDVPGELARIKTTLQESMKEVRRFIFDLRPASLTDAGLLPTLRQYTRDYSDQFGVPVELNIPENLVLSANQELAVFRIIQEALQNIHKHAEASQIEVSIQQRAGGPVVVTINDNGRGFHPQAVRSSRPASSGLVSMRERAATVGGTLKIDSVPGSGATITLVLPTSKA
jgi:two-component system sensor histidine kinase DegS